MIRKGVHQNVGFGKKSSLKKKPGKGVSNSKTVEKTKIWNDGKKKGRLIVRNLSFKITEEALSKHFARFGEIREVNILKQKDGKLIGCGFVEFTNKENAIQAIAGCSGKPLLNRPIIVDWAIPKESFAKKQKNIQPKPEIVEIKEESSSEDEIKEESSSKEEGPSQKFLMNVKDESEDERTENSEDEDDDEEEESCSEEEEVSSDDEARTKQHKKPSLPCDVEEGRTIFLKGVPFTATKEELREVMLKFGPLVYALICVDPLTEHPKGTAFVKYTRKESAEECLSAKPEQLALGTSILEPYRALEKGKLQQQTDKKKVSEKGKGKDGRNLYLIKEGVIMAGSEAAQRVSASDMARRLQLEQSKAQMLKNLSMVVSRTRLAIHNLPVTLDDDGLRKLAKKHAGAGAIITEVRVQRDLKHLDAKGRGRSKEFGFVAFTEHEHALAALRSLNNNPQVFSTQRRPIVSFSIENQAILNAKQRRLEQSRFKNPLYHREPARSNLKNSREDASSSLETHAPAGNSFSGIEAHPGQNVRLPTRGTLKTQAVTHRQSIQHEKRQSKAKRKIHQEKQQLIQQRKEVRATKQNVNKKRNREDDAEEASFSKLVSKYRKNLETSDAMKKWFDT